MPLPLDARAVQPEHVRFREVGGEAVLLNLKTEYYYGLDDVGTDIWHALIAAQTIGEALDHLLTLYDVKRERLQADIETLINQLTEHGLLEIRADV